jgi:hypothetical protein
MKTVLFQRVPGVFHTSLELFKKNLAPDNRMMITCAIVSTAVFVYIMLSSGLLALLGLHLPLLPAIACVPLVMHFSRFLKYASTELPALTIIGCFTMLLPCILATGRLMEYLRNQSPGNR